MAKKKERLELPKPLNDKQKEFVNGIINYSMTIVTGPAGTGKSYLSAVHAAHDLKYDKNTDKVIITRPTVPTGRSIGFFPGSLDEKMEPWVKPIMNTMSAFLGQGDIDSQIRNGNIEIVPFETIRGRSFENAFIILDEAQNCTVPEMKAFVTRQGNNSNVIINGDISQSDLHDDEANGLACIKKLVENDPELAKFIATVEFDSDDIVRSGLCKLLVQAFDREGI